MDMHLTVDGRKLSSLHIVKYTPKIELLDGEATNRTKAELWDMIRQPQGYIINFTIEFFKTTADNPDLRHLYNTCLKLGSVEFVSVSFQDNLGNNISQDMYFTLDGIDFLGSDGDNVVRTGNIRANFIAARGFKKNV